MDDTAFDFDPDDLFTLDLSLSAAADGNAASNGGSLLTDNDDSGSNDGSEDFISRAFTAGTRPCSNDSPEWAEKTVPCPNAMGITTAPTSSPPEEIEIVQNGSVTSALIEMPTRKPTTPPLVTSSDVPLDVTSNDAGLIRDVSPSPTKEPTSGAPQASNDIGDMDDLVTASPAITSAASSADEEEYPSFYSCSVSSQEELVQDSSSDAEFPLRFDYEIYTATGVDDVTAVLSTFERQLTNGVASSLGLADCPNADVGANAAEVAVRKAPWGGRRTLRTGHTSGARDRGLEGRVTVGISVDPVDELDTNIASCTSSATLDAPSECSPVIGAMTVWVTEAQRRHLRRLVDAHSQEEMLLNAVETYIGENEESYVNDDLLYVAYVGQRDLERSAGLIVADPITDGSMESVESGGGGPANSILVGLATAGALLALLFMGAVWVFRRRRRREAEEGLDPESGAFPGLTPELNVVTESFEAQMQASDEPMHGGDSHGQAADEPMHGGDAPGDELSLRTGREVSPSSLAALGGASTLVPNLVPQLGDSPSGTDSAVRQLSYSQDEKGGDVVMPPLDSTLNRMLDSALHSAPDSELFLESPPTIVEAEDNYTFKAVDDNTHAIEEPEPLDNPTIPTTNDEGHALRSNGLIL